MPIAMSGLVHEKKRNKNLRNEKKNVMNKFKKNVLI